MSRKFWSANRLNRVIDFLLLPCDFLLAALIFFAGMWLEAESLTRDWAIRYSTVYVISGSIFDEKNTGLRENDDDVNR